MNNKCTIYTDGSCFANGQPNALASWGFVCVETGHKEAGLVPGPQTNNRGELMGIIRALEYAQKLKPSKLTIYTDSQYCLLTIPGWNQETMQPVKKLSKKPKNPDLVFYARELANGFPLLEWRWIRGHTGNHYNEIADRLSIFVRKNPNQYEKPLLYANKKEEIKEDVRMDLYHYLTH